MGFLLVLLLCQLPFEKHSDITLYQIPKPEGVTMLVDLRLQPSSFVFRKQADRFVSEFEISIEVQNSEKERLLSDFWQYSQSFGTYSETKQIDPIIARLVTVKVPMNSSYDFKVRVNDLVANAIVVSEEFQADGYLPVDGVYIGDLIPIEVEASEEMRKKIGRTEKEGGMLHAYYEIFGGPATLERRYSIRTEDFEVIQLEKPESLSVDGVYRGTVSLNLDSIPAGRHSLQVEFIQEGTVVAEREIRIAVTGFRSLSDEDYETLVDMLLYIATNSEMRELKAVDRDDRAEAWDDFWKQHDPDPATPENPYQDVYMHRIRQANALFGVGLKPGWRTDRGMVYVKFGPPGEIERHPFDYESRPYEVWYYYMLDLEVVFIDRTGVGDYEFYEYDPRIYSEPFML
jgi:GWxTD domain-containing protein